MSCDVSKTADLLELLEAQRGRVLPDKYLIERFFPGPRGADHLVTAIAILRRSQPIERIPCVGYRMPLEPKP